MVIQGVSAPYTTGLQLSDLSSSLEVGVVSLEDRLIQKFAESSIETEQRASAIHAMLQRPDITDPEVLHQLQVQTSQYNIDVNLLSTLVNKTVKAVESTVRGQ